MVARNTNNYRYSTQATPSLLTPWQRTSLFYALIVCALTFTTPSPVAAQSTLYIAEFNNGEFSRATLNGTPPYSPITFATVTDSANDLVVDAAGGVYVSFRQGNDTLLRKYDMGGNVVAGFGTGGTMNTGAGDGALMSLSAGGTLLTVERQSSSPRLTRRDPGTGAVITNFNLVTTRVAGVAEDTAGFVYVSTGVTNQLARYNADGTGGVVLTVSGGTLGLPTGLDFDSAGRLLVMNASSNLLARYLVAGTTLTLDPTFGAGGVAVVPGSNAQDVDLDPLTGNIYISRYGNNAIYSFDSNGLSGQNVIVTGLSGPFGIYITPVPEPASVLAVGGVALAAGAFVRRWRREG
jgi:hypothetical protein